MDALDRALQKSGAVAYVMTGSSEYADMRYLTRFTTTDPIIYVRSAGERGWIIVSQMEYARAQQEAITRVMTRADAGLFRILEEEKDRWRAWQGWWQTLWRERFSFLQTFPMLSAATWMH